MKLLLGIILGLFACNVFAIECPAGSSSLDVTYSTDHSREVLCQKGRTRHGPTEIYYADGKLKEARFYLDGKEVDQETYKKSLVKTGPLDLKFIDIATGANFTCAVSSELELWCWGEAKIGNFSVSSKVPQRIPGFSQNILNVFITTSLDNILCVLLKSGELNCYYNAGFIPSGKMTLYKFDDPTKANVSMGIRYFCYRDNDSYLRCHGYNPDGSETHFSEGRAGEISGKIISVSAFENSLCVLSESRKVLCYGNNSSGQLGRGSKTISIQSEVLPVQGLSQVKELACSFSSCCVINEENQKLCWGHSFSTLPVLLPPEKSFKSISISLQQSCKLLSDNSLWCKEGQQETYRNYFTEAPVIKMGVTTDSACFLLANGKIKCLGSNMYGRLGNPLVTGNTTELIDVAIK